MKTGLLSERTPDLGQLLLAGNATGDSFRPSGGGHALS